MKLAAISVLSLSLASAALAQLTPGVTVTSGQPFPIVAEFNGDGLDDLIQETNVILNDGKGLTAIHDLGFDGEKVCGVLDVNGDHIPDLLTVGGTVMVPANLPAAAHAGSGLPAVHRRRLAPLLDRDRHHLGCASLHRRC